MLSAQCTACTCPLHAWHWQCKAMLIATSGHAGHFKQVCQIRQAVHDACSLTCSCCCGDIWQTLTRIDKHFYVQTFKCRPKAGWACSAKASLAIVCRLWPKFKCQLKTISLVLQSSCGKSGSFAQEGSARPMGQKQPAVGWWNRGDTNSRSVVADCLGSIPAFQVCYFGCALTGNLKIHLYKKIAAF